MITENTSNTWENAIFDPTFNDVACTRHDLLPCPFLKLNPESCLQIDPQFGFNSCGNCPLIDRPTPVVAKTRGRHAKKTYEKLTQDIDLLDDTIFSEEDLEKFISMPANRPLSR